MEGVVENEFDAWIEGTDLLSEISFEGLERVQDNILMIQSLTQERKTLRLNSRVNNPNIVQEWLEHGSIVSDPKNFHCY